jgi:uncharacterized protein YkwD
MSQIRDDLASDLRKVHGIYMKSYNNILKKDYNRKYYERVASPPFLKKEQSPSNQPKNPAQFVVATDIGSNPSVEQYTMTGPNPQRPTPPENPTPGDVWLNTNPGKINVWTGTTWLEITTPIGATPIQPKPELPKIGRKIIAE